MTDYRKDFPLLSEIGENTVDGREWIYIDLSLIHISEPTRRS